MAKQPALQQVLEEGFMWTVISSSVEDQVEGLANLFQAFNSNLAVLWAGRLGYRSGLAVVGVRLEVMLAIAKTYELQPSSQKDLVKSVSHAASSMPRCKGYMESVGGFVGSCAGGEQCRLLKIEIFGLHGILVCEQFYKLPNG